MSRVRVKVRVRARARASPNPDPDPNPNQAVLDAHASRLHLGGDVRADAVGCTDHDAGTASLRYEWKAEGEGALLTMALPHQVRVRARP